MRCPLLFGGGQGDILLVWRGAVRSPVCLGDAVMSCLSGGGGMWDVLFVWRGDAVMSCLSGGGMMRFPVCLE